MNDKRANFTGSLTNFLSKRKALKYAALDK